MPQEIPVIKDEATLQGKLTLICCTKIFGTICNMAAYEIIILSYDLGNQNLLLCFSLF